MLNKMKKKTDPETIYHKRKRWFWLALILIFIGISLVFYYCSIPSADKNTKVISVAICGEVQHPAVYHIAEGSDLGQLIRAGNGLTYEADIRMLDLSKVVMNDTVYHIPRRSFTAAKNLNTELEKELTLKYKQNLYPVSGPDKGINEITILYVGFPAVYMLINYYPDQKRVSIFHIPHSTLFLENDYRLIDIFFTIGIKPTVQMLERALQQPIDYYLIQDRFSFIDLVNLLGGIDLQLDAAFADAYKLKPGISHLDGFYTWEFIRFLDIKRMNVKYSDGNNMDLTRNDNFKIPPKSQQLAYELRQYRQRMVMNSLRSAYNQMNATEQLNVINKITRTFETDISKDLVLSLYKDVLSTPQFSFATLPGYYSDDPEKLYYYPDIPNFKLLLNQGIRKSLEVESGRKQTTY
jgi:anionic cell wall polymer biosynthesis LytR-Cps2A-Psr (LCP) family protein